MAILTSVFGSFSQKKSQIPATLIRIGFLLQKLLLGLLISTQTSNEPSREEGGGAEISALVKREDWALGRGGKERHRGGGALEQEVPQSPGADLSRALTSCWLLEGGTF